VGDVDAHGAAALELLSDEALRRKLAEQSRARALAEFPLEAAVERYAACYRDLLGRIE
jgi:glycosyltransferase involved in cell wall biosynthesis